MMPQMPMQPQSDHMLGVPDLPDAQVIPYLAQHGINALVAARADKLWAQVCKEYDVLTGDKKKDVLMWEDHQAYMQGALDDEGKPIEDPIMFNKEARDEYVRRLMEEK